MLVLIGGFIETLVIYWIHLKLINLIAKGYSRERNEVGRVGGVRQEKIKLIIYVIIEKLGCMG